MNDGFSHLDAQGHLQMVDVSDKKSTVRRALAAGLLTCTEPVRDGLMAGTLRKGEAIATAKVAGILAAKKTGDLIPLCHPLPITDVQISFRSVGAGIEIRAEVRCVGKTGVEMEAMTAVSVAGLTLYDMGKARDKTMTLEGIRLLEKSGGKSGDFRRDDET